MTRVVLALLGWGLVLVAGPAVDGRHVDGHAITRADSDGLPAVRTPAASAATWCGSATAKDAVPNLLAGNPVHWLYVIPSDGADRLSTFAHVMQTDAEAIDAWWRREDPTRTPRNDLRRLSCGDQLDISALRLQRTGADLDTEFNFSEILDAIQALDFDSAYTKYVVYYDGPLTPDDEGEVCGRGGSLVDGFGLAVVYVQSCIGVSTAAVAAHEILHTLDAVPSGAPNDCDGHVCDRADDLMYPFLGDTPLEAKLLDPGRNDYYGHSGQQTDAQDSEWLVRLNAQAPLHLDLSGPGFVAADVPGLRCARTCTTTWNSGTRLQLEASPRPNAKLVRWSGACSGDDGCALSVGGGRTVSALFAPRRYRLAVSVGGLGAVRSSRGAISCGMRCSATVPSHVSVRLTAAPAKGWKLRSWAGACRGTATRCTVPMTQVTRVRAVFVRAVPR